MSLNQSQLPVTERVQSPIADASSHSTPSPKLKRATQSKIFISCSHLHGPLGSGTCGFHAKCRQTNLQQDDRFGRRAQPPWCTTWPCLSGSSHLSWRCQREKNRIPLFVGPTDPCPLPSLGTTLLLRAIASLYYLWHNLPQEAKFPELKSRRKSHPIIHNWLPLCITKLTLLKHGLLGSS